MCNYCFCQECNSSRRSQNPKFLTETKVMTLDRVKSFSRRFSTNRATWIPRIGLYFGTDLQVDSVSSSRSQAQTIWSLKEIKTNENPLTTLRKGGDSLQAENNPRPKSTKLLSHGDSTQTRRVWWWQWTIYFFTSGRGERAIYFYGSLGTKTRSEGKKEEV